MTGSQKKTSQALHQSWMSDLRKCQAVPKTEKSQGNPWMSDLRKCLVVPKTEKSQGIPGMSNSRKRLAVPITKEKANSHASNTLKRGCRTRAGSQNPVAECDSPVSIRIK